MNMDTLIKDDDINIPIRNFHGVNIDTAMHKTFQPLYLCNINNDSQFSEKIYERRIPKDLNCYRKNLIPFRPSYSGGCLPKIHKEKPKPLENPKLSGCCNTGLWPYCGDHLGYLNNIEVDSNLKNINYMNNKCQTKKYKQPPLKSECVNLCCDTINSYPNLPSKDYKRNKCINFNLMNKCNNSTLYDYSKSEICNQGCQNIWNNRSKRNS